MRWPRPSVVTVVLAIASTCLLTAAVSAGRLTREGVRASSIHRGGSARGGSAAQRPAGLYPDAEPVGHNGADLMCADCHISHASQTHYLDPASPRPNETIPYTGGANAKLLRKSDPLDLCLACHDGQSFAPDVVTADAAGLTRRSAGFFEAPEVANPHGHDLARGLPKAGYDYEFCSRCHWSDGSQAKVTCVDCHDPHGNGRARNLQWASWPEGTPPQFGLFVDPTAAGLARYEAANVAYGTLDNETLREVSNMCLDCHHVFSGGSYIDPDLDAFHERHPTYDSERTSPNSIQQGQARGSSDPAHWVGGTGSGFHGLPRVRPVNRGATDFATAKLVNATTNGVFCLSCHQAHGSEHAFGLAWAIPDGASGIGPSGCDQCHNKAQ